MTTLDELRADDRRARLEARRTFDRPLALEAGAGTGKTATLVARIVSWAVDPGWERARAALASAGEDPEPDAVAARVLERVAAITFTEAAAAEMAERCGEELRRLSRGEEPPGIDDEDLARWREHGVDADTLRSRARELAAAVDRLEVRTIHAFCRALLARHPLEAGLAPGFEVDADRSRAQAAAREALEELLHVAWRDPVDPDVVLLMARGKGPLELEDTLVAAISGGARPGDLHDDPLAPERVAAFVERSRGVLAAAREAGIEVLAAASRAPVAAAAIGSFQRTVTLLEELAPTDAETLARWKEALSELWPENLRERLQKWGKRVLTKGEAEVAGEAVDAIAPAAAELHRWLKHALHLDPLVLGAARRVVEELLAGMERRLAAAGVISFEGLLRHTRALLEGRADVAEEERRRLDQLLVDEFQDTDAIQCAIVRVLGLEGAPEARPGLFLVGDPKQSIYAWRSADLEAYEAFRRGLEDHGGETLPLLVNFRSVPTVLDEVARAVGPVMEREEGLQPEFQRLLPREGAADDPALAAAGRAPVEYWVSWPSDPDTGRPRPPTRGQRVETYALEARAIAADVAALGRSGVRWSEIAILLRSSTNLEVVLEALRERGVPFEVRSDRRYYRRREIVDAIALVRAVLDPNDRLALVALLRSPWVGVPDAALGPLFARDVPELLGRLGRTGTERRETLLGELVAATGEVALELRALEAEVPGLSDLRGWDAALVAAGRALAEARRLLASEPADRFVEGLRRLFLPEAVSAARHLGAWRLPNLERFFRELLVALDESDGDAESVLRRLRTDLARDRDEEEARPLEAAEDAVQVATIHRAKGLGFAHVYFAQLHAQSGTGRRGSATDLARIDGRAQYVLFGAPTLDWDAVEARRARIEAAERVRLLYVATTRAKGRLVLCSGWEGGATGASDPGEAQSFEHLLGRRAGLEEALAALERRAEAPDPAAGEREEGTGVLFRLAAPIAGTGTDAAAARPEPVAPPPASALVDTARALAAARERARDRMARPWTLRASDASHAALAAERAGDGEEESAEDADAARAAALLSGTALHLGLERLDPALAAADAVDSVRRVALQALEHEPDPVATAARARVEAACRGLAGGMLLGRLAGGADEEVLARELPVLLAPDGEDAARPVGFVSGSIDLLLRERGTGALLVVDYKSDAVADDALLEERARAYAPQVALYARAVQAALGLAGPPRAELWFLAADRAVPVADRP